MYFETHYREFIPLRLTERAACHNLNNPTIQPSNGLGEQRTFGHCTLGYSHKAQTCPTILITPPRCSSKRQRTITHGHQTICVWNPGFVKNPGSVFHWQQASILSKCTMLHWSPVPNLKLILQNQAEDKDTSLMPWKQTDRVRGYNAASQPTKFLILEVHH